jgi:hypothetical protein
VDRTFTNEVVLVIVWREAGRRIVANTCAKAQVFASFKGYTLE